MNAKCITNHKFLILTIVLAAASISNVHASRRTTTSNPPPTSGTVDKLVVSPE